MHSISSARRMTTAFGSAVALVATFTIPATPAHAVEDVGNLQLPTLSMSEVQNLDTSDYDDSALSLATLEMPEAELSEEWLAAEAARIEAEKKEEARLLAIEQASSNKENEPRTYVDVPSGVGAEGIVAAALAQLGVQQDCTDLVQNSLAAAGFTQRRDQGGFDLGTGIWQYDHFGTRVDINSLAPGDILIYGNAGSGAHVSIYIGDGQAVHGGYSGFNTVIAGANSAWQPLTGAIRV